MSYFEELFGRPQLQRRENWNGVEEATQAIRSAWQKDCADPHSASFGLPQAPDTIDIDFEIVE